MGVEADELSMTRMMKRAEKVELLLLHQRKEAQQEGTFESSTVVTSVRDPRQQEIITTKKKFIRPDPTTVAVIESIQTSPQNNPLNNSNNNNNSNMNKRDQGWWRRAHDDRNINQSKLPTNFGRSQELSQQTNIRCWYCKEQSHYSKDCPTAPICQQCKRKGHTTTSCYQR
ncbi:unnamed protein product, partial [Didymodactylos carnosus]